MDNDLLLGTAACRRMSQVPDAVYLVVINNSDYAIVCCWQTVELEWVRFIKTPSVMTCISIRSSRVECHSGGMNNGASFILSTLKLGGNKQLEWPVLSSLPFLSGYNRWQVRIWGTATIRFMFYLLLLKVYISAKFLLLFSKPKIPLKCVFKLIH